MFSGLLCCGVCRVRDVRSGGLRDCLRFARAAAGDQSPAAIRHHHVVQGACRAVAEATINFASISTRLRYSVSIHGGDNSDVSTCVMNEVD